MMLSLTLLVAPAFAGGTYTSELQHVVLSDSANVFQETEVDSGWLPEGSPLQARFQIEGAGATTIVMEGDADLYWPTDLNMVFYPQPGSGTLDVDASLDAVTSVKFDLFGYEYEAELDRRGIAVQGIQDFDPFVLLDQTPDRVEVVDPDLEVELINYEFEVFADVGLVLEANLISEMLVGFEGEGWTVDGNEYSYATDVVNFPAEGGALQQVWATFVGAWDASFSFILTPALLVDAGVLGEYEVLTFEIPLTLASSNFEQAFPETFLEFPLPVIATDMDSYDFGEVEIGQVSTLSLVVRNEGLLDLVGEPAMTGSPYFTVGSGDFYAGPGYDDDVDVVFTPEAEGSFSATLLLSSNDPANPAKEIVLTGVGVTPPEEDLGDTGTSEQDEGDQANDAVISSEVNGCNCSSAGQRSGTLAIGAFLLGLAALGRRRRA